jgi:nitrite reductase/ring-hydroxylating ferredoxin subunit
MGDTEGATGAYVVVAALDDLRVGFVSLHEVEGRGVVLARTEAGVTAWDSTCPHAEFHFGPMRLQRGCELECPMHGARFHVADGRVLKGPATEPLEPIECRVEDRMVAVLVDWLF